MMTEQEFLDNLPKDITYHEELKDKEKCWDYTPSICYEGPFVVKKNDKPSLDDVILISWEIGGASGGNCWGDEAESYYVEYTEPPTFEDLNKILEKICPNIKYSTVKEINNRIVCDSYTKGEYYGNYTDYKYKFFRLKDIYDTLKKLKEI